MSVVEVTGSLDLSTVLRWQDDVEAAIHSSPAVVVDLSPVQFVDSAGVAALFRMLQAAGSEGTPLVVVAPHGLPARRVLEIVDLELVAPIYESRSDALGALL